MEAIVWCDDWWSAWSVMIAAHAAGYGTEVSEAGEGWLVEVH